MKKPKKIPKVFCWKLAYPTEEKAKEAFAASTMMAKLLKNEPPLKYYQCQRCGFWHMTTSDRHEEILK